MKTLFKILLFLFVIILISCSDKSTNPSNEQGTQSDFDIMIGIANTNFVKVGGNEPVSSTDPNKPILSFLSQTVSGLVYKKSFDEILSPEIPINMNSGQNVEITFNSSNISNLSQNNMELIFKPTDVNSYYNINPPYTISGTQISFILKTLTDAKAGTYHFKIGIKDLLTNLVSDYVYFVLNIQNSSNLNPEWKKLNDGLSDKVIFSGIVFKNFVLISNNDGVYYSTNSCNTWEESDLKYEVDEFNASSNYIFTYNYMNDNYIYFSINNGINWEIYPKKINSENINHIIGYNNILLSNTNINNNYTQTNKIYRSIDEGENWIYIEKINGKLHQSNNIIYAVSDTLLFLTTDYGENWNTINIRGVLKINILKYKELCLYL